MYILTLDRANIIRIAPVYQAVLVNDKGELIYCSDHLTRAGLKKLINAPLIDELAIWDLNDFNTICRLTSRNIIILKEWNRNKHHLRISNEKNFTLRYYFERIGLPNRMNRHPKPLPHWEWISNPDKSYNIDLTILFYKAKVLATVGR